MCAQRAGPTGGIVRADLQQCEATWDIRHFAGVRARLAHYLPIGSNDPQDMQHEVALRWYGTGADEKVEDRLFVCGATPLRRPSCGRPILSQIKARFLQNSLGVSGSLFCVSDPQKGGPNQNPCARKASSVRKQKERGGSEKCMGRALHLSSTTALIHCSSVRQRRSGSTCQLTERSIRGMIQVLSRLCALRCREALLH